MKKALAIILSICFVLCLTACSKDETASDVMSDISNDVSQTASTENQASDLTNSNESAELSEPTQSSEPAESSKPTESSKPIETVPQLVKVPSFIGLTITKATEIATANNIAIKVETEKEYISDYSDETIVRQSHAEDSYVEKGTTIIVYKNPPIENLFNFVLIDETTSLIQGYDKTHLTIGTYVLTSLNGNVFPSVLEIPTQYKGVPVTAVYGNLLDGKNIETIVFPTTIKIVGSNLCGGGCNCPNLKNIVCLGDEPFALGSFSLNPSQLNGGCKIYVPDKKVDVYKTSKLGSIPFKEYADLIYPISSLDEETKKLIS